LVTVAARLWQHGAAIAVRSPASPSRQRNPIRTPMMVIALVLAGNFVLAGLFSLVAVVLD